MKENKQEVIKGRTAINKKLIIGIGALVLLALVLVLWFCNSSNSTKPIEKPLTKQEIYTDFGLNSFSSEIELELLKE